MKTFTYKLSMALLLAMLMSVETASALKQVVLVGNFYFNPSSFTIQVGDTVRWQWVEGNHTTTSVSVPAGASSWDSPINSGNQFFEYKVTVAGTFNYHCTPHAGIQTGSFTASGGGPTLSVTPSNQNAGSSAGNTAFVITSNSAWTASSNQSWCTVTPPSGSGNSTLTATYTENTSTSQRVATLTVTVTGLSPVNVTVTQSGAALYLSVLPPNQNVTFADGSTMFNVSTNGDWTAISDVSWCTVNPSGSGNGTITASYTENPSSSDRVATITVSAQGTLTETVTVTQEGSGLGIDNRSDRAFTLFPNPANTIVTLIPGEVSNLRMEASILDLTGKTLYSEILSGSTSYRFDISGYHDGIYFIRLRDGNSVATKRIIKSSN